MEKLKYILFTALLLGFAEITKAFDEELGKFKDQYALQTLHLHAMQLVATKQGLISDKRALM